jgi:hypothetical protein
MGSDSAYICEIEVKTLANIFKDFKHGIGLSKEDMNIEHSANSCNMQNKVAYRNLTDNSLLVSTIDLYVQ